MCAPHPPQSVLGSAKWGGAAAWHMCHAVNTMSMAAWGWLVAPGSRRRRAHAHIDERTRQPTSIPAHPQRACGAARELAARGRAFCAVLERRIRGLHTLCGESTQRRAAPSNERTHNWRWEDARPSGVLWGRRRALSNVRPRAAANRHFGREMHKILGRGNTQLVATSTDTSHAPPVYCCVCAWRAGCDTRGVRAGSGVPAHPTRCLQRQSHACAECCSDCAAGSREGAFGRAGALPRMLLDSACAGSSRTRCAPASAAHTAGRRRPAEGVAAHCLYP